MNSTRTTIASVFVSYWCNGKHTHQERWVGFKPQKSRFNITKMFIVEFVEIDEFSNSK